MIFTPKAKTGLSNLAGLVALLFIPFILFSCELLVKTEPTVAETIAVKGEWVLGTGEWAESWTITDTSITYGTSYTADIVEFSNSSLNGNDTAIVAGGSTVGLGFAVIKFTSVNGAGTGELGKYQIFRWATNSDDASKRDFTQGSKDVDAGPNYVNEVFETPEAAKTGATIATSHFLYASQGASLK